MNEMICTLKREKQEKDLVIRSLKHDRRRHMEEVMQLKEESLLAAIGEKDAHIALLESTQNVNPGEVETVRQHKEKLLQKLKEENHRPVCSKNCLPNQIADLTIVTPLRTV
ncbi:unnamed protein product [Soboliphyme baturini]|uniref:Stathmin n=1 Tax=Soboliphyme baturini TaxID=241478 RepID=A0A183IFP8_9BILA|nr:unnamed protein product [Soboliphyme baturini]